MQKSEVKVWSPKFKPAMWKNLCVSTALPSAVILLLYFQVNEFLGGAADLEGLSPVVLWALNGKGTIPAPRASSPVCFGLFHLQHMVQDSTAEISHGKLQRFHHWFKVVWKDLKWWHIGFGKLWLLTSAKRQNVLEIIGSTGKFWCHCFLLMELFKDLTAL